jgi:hypothetical protein
MSDSKPSSFVWLWMLLVIGGGLLAALFLCAGIIVMLSLRLSSRTASDLELSPQIGSDFDRLGKWCKQSKLDIISTQRANPIRGDELKQQHLDRLRSKLSGKEVRWQFKVSRIKEKGVFLYTYWTYTVETVDRFGQTHEDMETAVEIYFNEHEPKWDVENISPQKLHDISVGDYVTVVGMVDEVSFVVSPTGHASYVIRVANARIE